MDEQQKNNCTPDYKALYEKEKALNAHIKARFVECNTCTPDKKEKCLMWSENLCEGERCNELVDLMQLINKGLEDKSSGTNYAIQARGDARLDDRI